MTDRVWLVRHGSTSWTGVRWCGRTDLDLSDGGLREVARLAGRLGGVLPDEASVLTSPARRAAETARAICLARSGGGAVAAGVMDELAEVDFGQVDGLTWVEVELLMPEVARTILVAEPMDWPGGESAADIDLRVRAVRERIEGSSAPLVLVSHAAILALIAGDMAATEPSRWALAPASAVELVRDGRSWAAVGSAR